MIPQPKKSRATPLALAAALAVISSARLSAEPASHLWQSDWGPVEVLVDDGHLFSAHYGRQGAGGYNGLIELSPVQGRRLSGYWARDCLPEDGGGFCADPLLQAQGEPTYCWGRIAGEVNASGDRFEGRWEDCAGEKYGEWNGRRIR